MDGTFLNDKKKYNVSRFNKLFKQLQEKEIAFVVASGNQYFQLRTFFPRNYKNITFISENGANILIGDQPFYNAELPKNIVMHTLNILDKLEPINLIVCGKKSAYILEDATVEQISNAKFYYPRIKVVKSWNELLNENDTFFKFALSFDPSEMTEKLTMLQITLKGSLIPVSSGHGDIDLIILGVNKYTGLKLLGKKWHISDSEIATFGDSGNDLEMLKHTKYSFAMENAQEQIKKAANSIIGSNNSEALLDTIESIINGNN